MASSVGRYDALIIGGGHNGMVCGAYLAKAGVKALVLERRPILGGACVSEESFPGYQVSTGAFVMALLQPKIILDLELHKFGYETIKPTPSFVPFEDGRSMILWDDMARLCEEFAKFSRKDAEQYPKYREHMQKLAPFLQKIIWETPPSMVPQSMSDYLDLAKLGWRFRKYAPLVADLFDVLTLSAHDYLSRWFESDAVIATMSYFVSGGGTNLSPRMPSTAFALLRPYVRDHTTAAGDWGYVRGGMGGVTKAIAQAGAQHGLEFRPNAAVTQILTKNEKAVGVVLDSGEEVYAETIISNADAKETFLKLVSTTDVSDDFKRSVRNIRTQSSTFKVHLALDHLPSFTSFDAARAGFPYPSQMRIGASTDYLDTAFDAAKRGGYSEKPFLTVHIPSLLDPTVAPEGKHLATIYGGHAAYELKDDTWAVAKPKLLNNVFDVLETYAPGFRGAVRYSELLTPLDLEQRFNLPNGHVHHGEITIDQIFSRRPVAGYANYRTPIKHLYLCGAATHPGGGVTGVPGHNAAREILKDLRK